MERVLCVRRSVPPFIRFFFSFSLSSGTPFLSLFLAEDLRVLSELLEDSEQAPPAELAEAVRFAVAEEAGSSPTPKRRRAPYLRAIAAMLALCIGLGGLGLFAAGRSGQKSADSGAANMAPALFGAARQAPEGAGGEGCDEAESEIAGYSSAEVTADGAAEPPAEMENGDSFLPEEAPVPEPAALAPSEPADGFSGKQEAGSVPGGLRGDNAGEERLAVTQEEALELVFQHLGGYESFPDAKVTEIPFQFTATQVYSPSMCLRPDEPVAPENDQHFSTWLTYYGLTPNGRYYQFWLFTQLWFPDTGEGHSSTLNFFAVSLDGSEVLQERTDGADPETWQPYLDAISN